MEKKKMNVVNTSVEKIDSLYLSQGKSCYVEDFMPDNALHVKMLWSPHAHARIKSIDISEAENMDGVRGVLYYGNVPRIPHCTAGQGYPEPSPYDTYMFDTKVRYVGDRVAAVAAETEEIAEKAVKKIKVEYELLEPVLSFDDALKENAPVIHDEEESFVPIPIPYEPEKNIAARVGMEAGDFKQGLKDADFTFDEMFETGYAQHTPMEPYVTLAQIDNFGRIVITTSTQVPFHCRRIVANTLDIPVGRIRVIKPRIGGGFGCKQEMLIEDVAAMFSLRTDMPVFFRFTREEMFKTGRTRHPIRFRMQYGVKKNGEITALGMDAVNNTGAYGGHGLTVMSCCGSKVFPLYHVNNIHFDAKAIYTNLPVGGAYRGFGATQAFFAVESMMDVMAEAIGMDPVEFRKINHIRSGESHPAFAALGEGKDGTPMSIGSNALAECIEIGAKEIGWHRRTGHKEKSGRYRRGIGMCCLMQGSSVPEIDMGAASIKMNEDGSFNVHVGATDLGTGSDTVMAQIAAEELETTADKMIVYSSDTDMTPFDVGAYASSTTYLSGEACRKTAAKVKQQILNTAAEMLNSDINELEAIGASVVTKDGKEKVTYSEISHYSLYENNQYQIAAVESHITHKSPPPFAAHYIEIEVDTYTGEIKVLKYVSAVDCGTAINPALAEGQVEGAVLNGISYALTEEYRFSEKGKMTNPSLKTYNIFSLRDKPEMKTILVPSYEDTGPFGAKSVSEICINGAMPGIANALYNATGVRVYKAPFTKERVWKALQEKKCDF
ncbi:MAG: molybdopterin-dependent oxidoreductase [Victivallales bacterium]|nr:molybdopterin-dependent oxidoreductase [Victivallales bacterium]MCF7889561.1 molybdopterin-dependent oxidoreductase [Victivallales bacterium]